MPVEYCNLMCVACTVDRPFLVDRMPKSKIFKNAVDTAQKKVKKQASKNDFLTVNQTKIAISSK